MKKRFIIVATLLSLILTFSVLFISVYAAVNQTISITNQISFVGNKEAKKFTINAIITGTTKEQAPTFLWEYDYENQKGLDGGNREVGDLEFDNRNKSLDQIHITYTFTIKNENNKRLIASFVGPGNLIEGLNQKTYAYKENSIETESTSVVFEENETAILKLKLTVSSLDFSCDKQPVRFSINIDVAS